MEIELKEKRTLITGGSGGIGRALTTAFVAAGANVCFTYHSHPEAAEQTVAEAGPSGGRIVSHGADVSHLSDVENLFRKMDDEWGGIDILINCAGMDGVRGLSWEMDPADFERVLRVNLMGTFYCSQQALKRMIPSRTGVILNISSVHEIIPWSGYAAYTASKAGVAMLTKTMAQEAGPHGVRVLSLAPGAIRTPINRKVWSDPAQLADLQSKIPLNRIGEPEEVARLAVMLCSDIGSYVTGSGLFIDGGMTAYPGFSHGG